MYESANKYKALQNIELDGFENTNVWEMLYTQFDTIDDLKNSFLNMVIRVIKGILALNYEKSGDGNVAFLYTHSSSLGRKDHCSYFASLCSTVSKYICLKPVSKKKISLYAIKNIKYLYRWKWQAENIGFNHEEARALSVELFRVKSQGDQICAMMNDADIVVTYYDAVPVDYYVTSLANKMGKKTATVMHGYYPKQSYCFIHSHSFYFIANSLYSQMLAKDAGIEHVLLGGPLPSINTPKLDKCENEDFIVILNGGSRESAILDNKEILRLADCLAEKIEMMYRVRFHPHDGEMVSRYKGSKWMSEISSFEETSVEAISKSSFVIVGNSSVLFDCVFMEKRVMKYSGNETIFDDAAPEVVFRCEQDMFHVYDRIISETQDQLKHRRKKIIGDRDVFNNYKKLFENMCQSVVNKDGGIIEECR